MRRLRHVCAVCALVCALAAVVYPLAGCGGGSDESTPNNWDVMLWDTGIWQ